MAEQKPKRFVQWELELQRRTSPPLEMLPRAEGVEEIPRLLSLPSLSPSTCDIGQAYLKAQRSRHLGNVSPEIEDRLGRM